MNLNPNTEIYAATVEFRDHAEFLKGPAKGKGFEWVTAEGANAQEIFSAALIKAKSFGEFPASRLDAASMLMISIDAQWDENGHKIS